MIESLKKHKLRVLLWSAMLSCVAMIFLRGMNLSGRVTYVDDSGRGNHFIGKLSPIDRLATGSPSEIISNPIYFSLRTLQRYDKAKLTVEYENEDQPVIEAGVLVDNRVWRYDLHPLENKIIDRLSKEWNAVDSDGNLLLQRQAKYSSIADFLQSPPQRSQIALYNFPGSEIESEFLIAGYHPENRERVVDRVLRGNYQFFTYIKDEELKFFFEFSTLNKNKNPDSVDINLYYEDNLIDTRHLDGQKDPNDWGNIEKKGRLELSVPDLPEGVYKVEVKANDDVITDNIRTAQSKLSFVNRLWLHEAGRKDVVLYTDSDEVSFNTVYPGSLQTISLDGEVLKVDKTYSQFSRRLENDRSEITLEKDGMIVAGNGVFAFGRNDLIDPSWKQVDKDFRPEGVDYVLAKYRSPETDGKIKVATTVFDLGAAYSEPEKSIIPFFSRLSRRYSFMLSIPSLRGDGGDVKIKRIIIELEGGRFSGILRNM